MEVTASWGSTFVRPLAKRAPRTRMKPWLSLRTAVDWDCCTTVLNCSSCHQPPDHISCDDASHSATWFRQSRESAQPDQLHQRPQAPVSKNKRNALESPNNGRTCSAVMPVGPPVAHLLDERRFLFKSCSSNSNKLSCCQQTRKKWHCRRWCPPCSTFQRIAWHKLRT